MSVSRTILSSLIVASAAAQTAIGQVASIPLACYRFNRPIGTSATGNVEQSDSAWYDVELRDSGRVARTTLPNASRAKSYAVRSKWQIEGDTLHLLVFDGLTGWDMRLTRAGDGFSGSARYLTDAIGGDPVIVPVSAERVYCYTREQLDYRPSTADLAFAARMAGCYVLVPGRWQTDTAMSRFGRVPSGKVGFELTTVMISRATSAYDRTPYFRVRMQSDPLAQWDVFTTWVRVSKSSPTILISTYLPLAGFALRVHPRGSDLVGTMSAFTDAVQPGESYEVSRPVVARRTKVC